MNSALAGSLTSPLLKSLWRHLLLVSVVAGSLALMFLLFPTPLLQSPGHHDFSDQRAFLGLPNFLDVTTNLPFLLIGLAGMRLCFHRTFDGARLAWMAFFAGVAFVSAGSACYHWSPRDDTLMWDRLPITIGFMALFAALLGERVNDRVGRVLLLPAMLLGCGSVLYWRWFDDLRFYAWVQYMPLLVIPILMGLFRSRHTRQWLLLAALGCYVLAKITEVCDRQIFELTGALVSGHTMKHLLAALACFVIFVMLKTRSSLEARTEEARPFAGSTCWSKHHGQTSGGSNRTN